MPAYNDLDLAFFGSADLAATVLVATRPDPERTAVRIANAVERIAAVLEGTPRVKAPRKPRAAGTRLRRDPRAGIEAAEAIAPPTSISEARAERALRKLGWVR